MNPRHFSGFVALAAAVAISGWANAEPLTAVARSEVVQDLAAAMRARYVVPEVGAQAADLIASRWSAGAYESILMPGELAQVLTSHLKEVAPDQHLGVESDANPNAVFNLAPPPKSEAGVVRADRLDDRIGYIEIVSFPPKERFKPTLDRAMTALAGSRALIIDVRRNTGGDPAAVSYLASFLIPPGSMTHINDIVSRQPGTSDLTRQAFYSEPTPVSFSGIPLRVLTSASTFSGGEEFAYDIQGLGIGAVVGERTRGGANPTAPTKLRHGFTVLVPFARAENPYTKTNWDGRGVQPDVSSTTAEAFSTALQDLGGPAQAAVEDASRAQVFAPRSAAAAGSEAAVRRLLGEISSGNPNYAAMTERAESATRRRLEQTSATLAGLGPLRTVTFVEVDAFGGDLFETRFENGAARVAIALNQDGRIDAWALLQPTTTEADLVQLPR